MAEASTVHAKELAKKQRAISVAEFFEKNRHLLGFDNMTKSLLTVVKEAVDNSLDACEEAGILPEIKVEIKDLNDNKYKVIIEDNGPGIVKEQIPRIFGKLLYGSKFGRGRQGRGQQGIGISSAVLYSQLTTGKPTIIYSKPDHDKQIHKFTLKIDTKENEPEIISDEVVESGIKHTGTKVELIIEGRYIKTGHSVDEYIKQTSVASPWGKFTYKNPNGEKFVYNRSVNALPKEAKEIKPHPHGVEMGVLMRMLQATTSKNVSLFLQKDFCRVGSTSAEEICRLAKIETNRKPDDLSHEEQEKLLRAMQKVQIMRPPTDCLSPIGAQELEKGLQDTYKPEFTKAITRSPVVYRGNPFQVEAAIAYGGELSGDQTNVDEFDEKKTMKVVKLMRFGNKIPLLYEQGSCAITKSISSIKWRRYGLDQPGGGLPYGPVVIVIHVFSTWVPYTSESKEAIASYDEITNEIKLAVQECARALERYVSGIRRAKDKAKRASLFVTYMPEIVNTLSELSGEKKETIETHMVKVTEKYAPKPEELKEVEENVNGEGTEGNTEEA